MNQKTLTKLEYYKITALLEEQASSMRGKQLCRKLKPMTDPEKINTAQEQTEAAFTRIRQKGTHLFWQCIPHRRVFKTSGDWRCTWMRRASSHLQSFTECRKSKGLRTSRHTGRAL